MRRGRIVLVVMIPLLAVMAPQSVVRGQAAETQRQRFGAGWIDMPAKYKFEHVVGPDFDVDYLIPNDVQLDKARTMLGLYTGTAPSFNPPAKGVKIRAGHFGARKIKWHIYKAVVENQTTYHHEALIRLKGGLWVWHLFLAAPDRQRMQELASILASYRTK